MLHWFEHLLTSVNPLVVHILIGLVVMIESMGIPLPGETILVAAALLAGTHSLNASPHGIAFSGAAGAIIGDSIGYWVVREYGDRLLRWVHRRFPKLMQPLELAWAQHIFKRYGFAAVFLGRFVALLRMFAGPLSGLMRMHYYKFLAANALGGVLWSCMFTYVIYYAGEAAESSLKGASWIALAVVVALAVGISLVLKRQMGRILDRFKQEHPDEVHDAEQRLGATA